MTARDCAPTARSGLRADCAALRGAGVVISLTRRFDCAFDCAELRVPDCVQRPPLKGGQRAVISQQCVWKGRAGSYTAFMGRFVVDGRHVLNALAHESGVHASIALAQERQVLP